jgi:hypothetical protein
MAKAKTEKATSALALVDIPAYGALCGDVITGSADLISYLVEIGQADAHESAVAYAKSQGASVKEIE